MGGSCLLALLFGEACLRRDRSRQIIKNIAPKQSSATNSKILARRSINSLSYQRNHQRSLTWCIPAQAPQFSSAVGSGASAAITNDRPAIVTTESSQSCPLAADAEPARNCLIAACFTTNCSALRWALSCSLTKHGNSTLHNCRCRCHGR